MHQKWFWFVMKMCKLQSQNQPNYLHFFIEFIMSTEETTLRGRIRILCKVCKVINIAICWLLLSSFLAAISSLIRPENVTQNEMYRTRSKQLMRDGETNREKNAKMELNGAPARWKFMSFFFAAFTPQKDSSGLTLDSFMWSSSKNGLSASACEKVISLFGS